MDWRVLGPVEVLEADAPLALGGTKPRLLLAVLLARRGHVVPVDVLVDALWGDRPPPTAAPTVQSHVSRLRRALGTGAGALEARPPGYRLRIDDGSCDAARFERNVAAAREHVDADPSAAREAVAAALASWRGDAFGEFAHEEAVRPEARRLEDLRVVAHEIDVDARLADGRHRETVGVLEGLVTAHPLHEHFWARLMLALYRSGRAAEALGRSRELRRLLRDEVGLDPGPDVRRLESDVLAESPVLDWTPPPVVVPGPRSPVPSGTPGDTLVGRADALRILADLVAGERLVTVMGTGGVGKTRLTGELLARRPDVTGADVRTVELAPVLDGTSVPAALAAALDVRRRPERSLEESVVDVLASRAMLLVLDNCEHVLDAVAGIVDRLLAQCRGLRVLATSRAPLGLAGEVTWVLPPLALPPPAGAGAREVCASPAGELFARRAAAARPGFTVDAGTAGAVAEICVRLDGVPLALELAAARVRSMTVGDVAARLDERFRLLIGRRGGDPRHRTLIDVVTWSHDLLRPAEQELLARLAVFAGTVDLSRIETVCAGGDIDRADVAALLAALVDQSMVVAGETGRRMRYRLLETVREFARERFEDRPDAAARRLGHARAVLEAAEAAARDLDGPDERRAVHAFEADLSDVREGFRSSLALGDLDTALGLVVAVREFAFRTVRDEVFAWADAASQAAGAREHPRHPLVRAVVAYGSFVRGDLERAIEVGHEALASAERLGATTCALAERTLVNAHFFRGEPAEALRWAERLLAAARAGGDDALVAHAGYMVSVAYTSVDDTVRAAALAEESRAAAERCGSRTARAQALYAQGLGCERDDPDRAAGLLRESGHAAGSVGNRWLRAFARTEELALRAQRGDPRGAAIGFRDVVDTWFRGGDWANQWLSLRHVVAVFAALGEEETAALLTGAIESAGAGVAMPFEPAEAARTPDLLAGLRARLGDAAFDAAAARGRALPDEEVVRLTLRRLETIASAGGDTAVRTSTMPVAP